MEEIEVRGCKEKGWEVGFKEQLPTSVLGQPTHSPTLLGVSNSAIMGRRSPNGNEDVVPTCMEIMEGPAVAKHDENTCSLLGDKVVGSKIPAHENVEASVNVETTGIEIMEVTVGDNFDMGCTTTCSLSEKLEATGKGKAVASRTSSMLSKGQTESRNCDQAGRGYRKGEVD
ncbi:hypothetical protein FH972_000910 [Carpinus fangiana]|uniref:Uncharacterized protein n=1 Tax=Carpinus fangiana TaxID=176857 RepID=A0A5N6QAA6_9ROSI|nr:hypothetical protein FH972_000910 [Carpinus fangiana]